MPDLTHEMLARADGFVRVAGVDEVGRGPLAGPVMAAAIILDPARIPEGIDDSKLLGPARREMLGAGLSEVAEISLGEASVAEIDELNILRASHLAMIRAIEGLRPAPDAVLIDGHLVPLGLRLPARAIVGGDGVSLSVAAASIVAKIRRDRVMRDLAQHWPGYGWKTNMGYATKSHRSALADLGPSPHHRRSFRPVYQIL